MREILLVDKNKAEANYYLGFMFEKGQGVDKDVHTAFSYYLKAAEQKYP